MPDHSISVQFLKDAHAAAQARGDLAGAVITKLATEHPAFTSGAENVPPEQFAAVTAAAWRATADELFALGTRPAPIGTSKLLVTALLSSVDLSEALARLQNFSAVLPAHPTVTISHQSPHVNVVVAWDEPQGPAEFLLTQLMLTMVHRLLAWLIDTELPPVRADLVQARPRSAEHIISLFSAPVYFGQRQAALVFTDQFLRYPILRTDTDLTQWLPRQAEQLYAPPPLGTTTAARVRRILQDALNGTLPDADDLGSRLAVSTKHLGRLLHAEGTSLSQLRQDVQLRAATASLAGGVESTSELSKRLGFSEPSAFHRAFRRWTGSSVGDFRRHLADTSSTAGPTQRAQRAQQ
ncbi:AraC family transcriptional regulator [Mycolicibacterium sp. YH-1]|uniref:helix-turn-helix domain-containing protein n=1 Tax=Mycolicibacterium sp. YH-1 TaxID=2908837 RepID=UPI001F4C28C0|nr:AraC family transcriptional regulator [Mycolicibacterium sp. YH-1]UNB52936.1 AraC family transcriptional regulator [Mycolicibacterium sp. YH-1]